MKAKRQKVNKRHMSVYIHSFGFRQPYQIIVDGNFLEAIRKIKRESEDALSKLLNGNVKLMTTYCCYAELKKLGPDFRVTAAHAKKLEKRRCTHKPSIAAAECIKEIVGDKNQFRYAVATQDKALRAHLRSVPAVPLMYINNSVLILEPPAQATTDEAHRLEMTKIQPHAHEIAVTAAQEAEILHEAPKKRKRKEPNPLSVKRKKPKAEPADKKAADQAKPEDESKDLDAVPEQICIPETHSHGSEDASETEAAERPHKRRRAHRGGKRRKPSSQPAGSGSGIQESGSAASESAE